MSSPTMTPAFGRVGTSTGGLLAAWLWASMACGPAIALESGGDEDTTEGPSSSTTTGPSPTTTSITTTPPSSGVTTDPPLDTGEFDTGAPWLDLPEDCSLIEQDCPPGYKCMPYANDGGSVWNDTKCVAVVEDPNLPGEPCTVEGNGVSGIDDCDATSMCWDVDPETNEGICVAQCIGEESTPTCLDPCSQCTIASDGILALCIPTCDPLTQDCDVGEGCYPFNENYVCVSDASRFGAGVGTACEFINACPPGLVCFDSSLVPDCEGAIGCCTPVCPVGGADPCPGLLPGTECTPWFSEPLPQTERCLSAEPGVCASP